MLQLNQAGLEPPEIEQQTEKILAHALFARSERMGRFLRFAVEQSLRGKSAELKEYLIGVEVFDRGPDYDPRVDPIVRVEARRLRSKLKAYYDGDGREDPIVIEFPSGAYAPQFCLRAEAEPAAITNEPAPVTMAVLPFVNLSGNPDNQYLSDGITEELIHSLTRLGGMRVVAWSSAERLRGREEDILTIRHKLNAGAALTGSVRTAGINLRVRVQLIDTRTGVYLWSETFDREMQDVFAIQEEIALAIVRTLRIQFAAPGSITGVRGRTTISAYDWCLKGRYCWHRRSPEDLARSIQCFENALAADPNSALAHAGLADTYSLLAEYGVMHPSESIPKAETAAARAIAIDPKLGEAHVSLAFIRSLYHWEWVEAERLYHRAITLNPGYATAYHWLGMDLCAVLGRFDEGEAHVEYAAQLDPLSSIIQEGRAHLCMLRGQHEQAIARYRKILAADPSFFKGYTSMGRAYAQQGNYAEALSMLLKGRKLAGDLPSILAASGQIYALAGDTGRARAMLAELGQQALHSYVPSTCFALVHIGLGEKESALQWLERACDQRELPVTGIKVHPVYDPLRGEPRFQNLLKRLRLD